MLVKGSFMEMASRSSGHRYVAHSNGTEDVVPENTAKTSGAAARTITLMQRRQRKMRIDSS